MDEDKELRSPTVWNKTFGELLSAVKDEMKSELFLNLPDHILKTEIEYTLDYGLKTKGLVELPSTNCKKYRLFIRGGSTNRHIVLLHELGHIYHDLIDPEFKSKAMELVDKMKVPNEIRKYLYSWLGDYYANSYAVNEETLNHSNRMMRVINKYHLGEIFDINYLLKIIVKEVILSEIPTKFD